MAQSKTKEEVFSLFFRNAIYSVILAQNNKFFKIKVEIDFEFIRTNFNKTFIYTVIIQNVGSC